MSADAAMLAVDFSIIIGGMNSWPLQSQSTDFAIPRALVPVYDRFGRFYTNAHR
jgi:cullin 1